MEWISVDRTNDLNTARQEQSGSGTYTSAVCASGTNPSTSALAVTEIQVANTETWDGTNWTETTEINTARSQAAAVGTGTASLLFGGDEHPGSPRLANETIFGKLRISSSKY